MLANLLAKLWQFQKKKAINFAQIFQKASQFPNFFLEV